MENFPSLRNFKFLNRSSRSVGWQGLCQNVLLSCYRFFNTINSSSPPFQLHRLRAIFQTAISSFCEPYRITYCPEKCIYIKILRSNWLSFCSLEFKLWNLLILINDILNFELNKFKSVDSWPWEFWWPRSHWVNYLRINSPQMVFQRYIV